METELPVFPEFVRLGVHHQSLLTDILKQHQPYSDYNFISLWSWDHQNKLQLSTLNGNLVIRFQDYLEPDKYFYSFLGTKEADRTASTLLEHSEPGQTAKLKLIPEVVIKSLQHPDSFLIEEDRDSFDYIIATNTTVDLEGKSNESKRHSLNQFTKNYGHQSNIREIDIKQPGVAEQMLSVINEWGSQTAHTTSTAGHDLQALHKMLNAHHSIKTDDLHIIGIYLDDKLRAFSINELLGNGFAIGHYKKADRNYKGLGVTLDHATAQSLQNKGITHLNHEQDLGIEGLRKAKLRSHPVFFLKKYTLSRK